MRGGGDKGISCPAAKKYFFTASLRLLLLPKTAGVSNLDSILLEGLYQGYIDARHVGADEPNPRHSEDIEGSDCSDQWIRDTSQLCSAVSPGATGPCCIMTKQV